MSTKRIYRLYLIVISFVMLSLVACGKGSDDEETNTKKNIVSGKDGNKVEVSQKEEKVNKIEDEVSLEQLVSDMQKKDPFSSAGIAITKIDVIKRQTNVDSKEDKIYITVFGENDSYSVEYHYQVLYNLYNEGWILDELNPYQDDEHMDSEFPKSLPDDSAILSMIEEKGLAPTPSRYLTLYQNKYSVEEIQGADNQFLVTYEYEYLYLTETVKFTAKLYFQDRKWDVGIIDKDRDARINETVAGQYVYTDGTDSNSTSYVGVFINHIEDEEASVGYMRIRSDHSLKYDQVFEFFEVKYLILCGEDNVNFDSLGDDANKAKYDLSGVDIIAWKGDYWEGSLQEMRIRLQDDANAGILDYYVSPFNLLHDEIIQKL